ncbi:hypothetical protein J6TS1_34370 [Siminovitchia terrae]|uniref:YwdI family protein n=1 Tax=Siminovitchia terrae TaxID=1914933 RepID=A0A429XC63_SIMTE|nr:YwdI family protein [Siminovitchia terrae]RST60932.1 hypothetical protein D5F11_002450 [Siminovitchia terrae]GIN90791.1 hypothetical protein J22TS1_18420 [Siminovitchia terrae]GIN97567.1 hypothetical protein J6TS1_34370 [Siminovitchia terrae]
MHITYEALITKMESELQKARASKDYDQMRGHLFAVKALAELTLDTGKVVQKEQPQVLREHDAPIPKEASSPIDKYDDHHDDGDSIFDF